MAARRLKVRLTLSLSLAVLGVVVTPAPARAFCRTMTVKQAADYKEATCFAEGVPLWWRNACVGYSVFDPPSRLVAYNEAAEAFSTAFTRWTGVSCPTAGGGRSRPSIDVRDLGPVHCGAVQLKSGVPNQNVVTFRDDAWDYPKEVLGLTTVQFAKDTGEIFGADMEINTKYMEPIAFRDPVENGQYDFLSIVTHEAGHFLGIAHSPVKGSTMFWSYKAGQSFQRILSPDDVNAVCSVYRPDGTRSVVVTGKEERAFKGPGCDPTPRGGFTQECVDSPACEMGRRPARDGARTAGGWAFVLMGCGLAVRRVRGRSDLRVRCGAERDGKPVFMLRI